MIAKKLEVLGAEVEASDRCSTIGLVGTAGTRRALRILLAEDSFSGQQAYQWGLIAKVVPADAQPETRLLVDRLAQNPIAAIAGTKALVYQAGATPTGQQLDAGAEQIIAAMQTDAFRAAVKQFTSESKSP